MSTHSYHFGSTFAEAVAQVPLPNSVYGVQEAAKFSSFVLAKLAETGRHQQELVEKTGLTRVTISRHLNGHKLPHFSNRKMYADFFGIDSGTFERGWRAQETLVVPLSDQVHALLLKMLPESGAASIDELAERLILESASRRLADAANEEAADNVGGRLKQKSRPGVIVETGDPSPRKKK